MVYNTPQTPSQPSSEWSGWERAGRRWFGVLFKARTSGSSGQARLPAARLFNVQPCPPSSGEVDLENMKGSGILQHMFVQAPLCSSAWSLDTLHISTVLTLYYEIMYEMYTSFLSERRLQHVLMVFVYLLACRIVGLNKNYQDIYIKVC